MNLTPECLSIASFLGFVEVCRYRKTHPQVDFEEVVHAIRTIKPDSRSLDFDGARLLFEVVGCDVGWDDTKGGVRLFVDEVVRRIQPWWVDLAPLGRDRVRAVLRADEEQCLRQAGLLDISPDDGVVEWWDRIASDARKTADAGGMANARHAERLSLEYERQRLARLGVAKDPQWVALEDNTLGYDILSYDVTGSFVVSRLIEVKSTTTSAIFITRNQWDRATRSHNTVFHFWKLPEEHLVEYPAAALGPNMPQDQGKGSWQKVRLPVSL